MQVVVGSFIVDGRKEPKQVKPQEPTPSQAELATRPAAAGGGGSEPSGGAPGEALQGAAGMAEHGGGQESLPGAQWT